MESSEFPYAPQKEQLAQHRWSLVGEGAPGCMWIPVCVRKAHGRESGSLSLTLGFNSFRLCCCVLDPPSSGKTQIIDIWSFPSQSFAHLIPQAQLHSLPGMSLAFLSPSFSLPDMPYLLNLTPTAWPMSIYSCTKRPKNCPIRSHSNLDADKGIPTAPNFPSKERITGAEHHPCPSHVPGCLPL